MPSVWPEYHSIDSIPSESVLAVVGFGDALTRASVCVPMRQLGSQLVAEVWRSDAGKVQGGKHGDVSFVRTNGAMFGTVRVAGDRSTDAAAYAAYSAIVEAIRSAGYPHLIRAWNHLGGVNLEEDGVERYKRFSAGRHDALTGYGFSSEQFPAASAVGMSERGLIIYFLAGREAGEQVENPRQVSAYEYPPQYGRRAPSFARATLSGSQIFVAGTSSVVGHESVHVGEVIAQLDETLANLDVIIRTAAARRGARSSLEDLVGAKVYIRNASDYDAISARLREAMPQSTFLFVESDICRRDLLLEIEGVVRIA